MQLSPAPVGLQWNLSFGGGFWGVLGDAILAYLAALLLLSFLGAGIWAVIAPASLRKYGWMATPLAGYSVLVTSSAFLVALGANIAISLSVTLAVSCFANLWAALKGGGVRALGPRRWLFVLVGLSFFGYVVTAVSMAHNGSTAYVGPNTDPYMLFSVAEWLKTHSAPLFSTGAFPPISPNWDGNLPPFGGWSAQDAHLSSTQRPGDTYLLFQRGPVYLVSSLGLLLGWDASLVLRPVLALLLSFSLPATFLVSRCLLRTSTAVSLLAALLVGMNSTVFFWVSLAHGGQAAAMFMTPTAILVIITALSACDRQPVPAAILVLCAALVSYYPGLPLLLALLLPSCLYVARKTGRRREVATRALLIGLGVSLLSLAEHVRVMQAWVTGGLIETTGWGSPGFPALGDGLGTTLYGDAFKLVTAGVQIGESNLALIGQVTWVATLVAALFGLVGVISGRAAQSAHLRLALLAAVSLLSYLRLDGYPYGFLKAQAVSTPMFAIAIALGLEQAWRWSGGALGSQTLRNGRGSAVSYVRSSIVTVSALFLFGVVAANLGMGAYPFWKPVGNIWNPSSWEAGKLTRLHNISGSVKLSPNILADPESLWVALYFLRNQPLEGTFAVEGVLRSLQLFNTGTSDSAGSPPSTYLAGSNEIAAANGLGPADLIWGGSWLKLYRVPAIGSRTSVALRHPEGSLAQQHLTLPTTAEIEVDDGSAEMSSASPAGRHLVITIAAESPATAEISTSTQRYLLPVGVGLSVRSVPVANQDHVTKALVGASHARILSAWLRADVGLSPAKEDHPEVLMVKGTSSLEGESVTTRFTYLNVQVPLSHSVDIYDSSGSFHAAWFKLPTNPDGRFKDFSLQVNGSSLEHELTTDGDGENLPFSVYSLVDGQYTAYFSIWSGSSLARRIPLYRYILNGGKVTSFEPFTLFGVWDGRI